MRRHHFGTLLWSATFALAAVAGTGAVASVRASAQAVSPALRPAAASGRKTLDSAAQKFLDEWGTYWRRTQSSRLPTPLSRQRRMATSIAAHERRPYFHCHSNKRLGLNEQLVKLTGDYAPISASFTAFSVCPTWPLDDEPTFPDEDGNIDAALLPSLRDQATTARAKFLGVLERYATDNPRDNFVAGQRVRFLLDQQLDDSAYAVSQTCLAEQWWCVTLQAYTEFQMGRTSEAGATFVRARGLMHPTERCLWEDISALAPDEFFQTDSESHCYGRDVLNKQYWWLADPMWSVAGNERRVEHDARVAQIRLQSGFGYDGRSHWISAKGSDALGRMVLRYGWPSYLAWGGVVGDLEHGNWLKGNGSPEQPPYTTYEYSRGRVHTAAAWEVLANPFAATDSAWQLNEPRNFSWRKRWWPDEFTKRPTPLVQLPRGQTAMLRRKGDIILALATDITTNDAVRVRDGSPATLLIATGPDIVQVVATSPMKIGGTVFGRGRIGSHPALLALEARDVVARNIAPGSTAPSSTSDRTGGDSVMAEARTRFSIVPPATLDEMRAGEVAISEAVLLRVTDNAVPLAAKSDTLLAQMLGSVVIDVNTTPKVGVYWETYGVSARDSVTVGVQVERQVSVGGLRRLGMALRLADNPNSTVNIAWREPDRGRTTNTIDGVVPIQSRTVILDLSRLESGPYDLVMSVAKIRGEAVTSVKRIVIAR